MFISFPVIADEWLELSLLVSSLRNEVLSDQENNRHIEYRTKSLGIFET